MKVSLNHYYYHAPFCASALYIDVKKSQRICFGKGSFFPKGLDVLQAICTDDWTPKKRECKVKEEGRLGCHMTQHSRCC